MNDGQVYRSRRYQPPKADPAAEDGEHGAPPIGDDEVDREENDLESRIVSASSLALEPEPQRLWIVEDVIPTRLTLVTGNGGVGKTTLMLQWPWRRRSMALARHEGRARTGAVLDLGRRA